ncbi:hypothetical protein [Methylobacterium radiotolerans]|uniref:Uncharacterized protein n=1 Tax=Methylobacterium radiotolerans (strain ATCC 27329 / DSM 1819 / JCM 2831 / NBRC 15690 / NCIMB 10815 / 0-1) TaxID=426355 RepID=B1M1E2_METRJ|nr:hypothetical protein [Methylobacterium radiotolerans]ACB26117.1 hypothetical protein Mrad2831_4148 [Methylobacterium radiotolerans JCM 2831]GEN01082.1 hypothetical protein MRA01_56210 [Methylobacterium radiotolerans]
MPHARTSRSGPVAPVRRVQTGRVSLTDRCRTLLTERTPDTDAALALLPLAETLWAEHVKARRAVRIAETPTRISRAEAAFQACETVAEAIINAPMPRTSAGLRALSIGVAMAYEGCLDRSEPVHNALWQLVCGVMMSVEGGEPPEGFETFSDRG